MASVSQVSFGSSKQAGIRRFDLVWTDLQGAELLALLGMGEMLHTVRALQLEIT